MSLNKHFLWDFDRGRFTHATRARSEPYGQTSSDYVSALDDFLKGNTGHDLGSNIHSKLLRKVEGMHTTLKRSNSTPVSPPLNQPQIVSKEVDTAKIGPQTATCDLDAVSPVIHLIEDNPAMREDARVLFESEGWEVRDYYSAEDFLVSPRPSGEACLVIDVMLPGMSGVALLQLLRTENLQVPAVILTGRDDAATAVAALKAGATDFIEKPAARAKLLSSVIEAMELSRDTRLRQESTAAAIASFDTLTSREQQVMMLVLDGMPNKNIAADLGLSQRTVENHRASVMRKTGAPSLPALVALFLEANGSI